MPTNGRRFSRRTFLKQSAVAAGVLAGAGRVSRATAQGVTLPAPESSGIDHVVVCMMENRSFDHFLGWVKGADGRQGGLRYTDLSGAVHRTSPLAPDYQGCGHPDPDHSYTGGRVEYNGGACDGWLRAGQNDDYAIGFYTERDLLFFAQATKDFTVCDRMFSAIMAETFPNRIYMHAAQTDRIENTFELSTLPTIWDRVADAGLQGRYYFSDIPMLALWGGKYASIGRPFDAFLTDCAAGTLPALAYVEPRFLGEQQGLSNDDHPHADIRNGQAFLADVYQAVASGPGWDRTVLVITYDEWGGFFDHVPPPTGPIPEADALAGNQDGLFGFRVPNLIVSPFATKTSVSHAVLDHTSILRMVEWRWNLPPLTARDATATNLAEVLDFEKPMKKAPRYNVAASVVPTVCVTAPSDEWLPIESLARVWGWL